MLYSFEDITTRLGIEDGVLNSNSEYSMLETELSRTNIEELGYDDFKDLIEKESCSIQNGVIKQEKTKTQTNLWIDFFQS